MALIRCTCIYRTSTPDETALGGPSITITCRDPHCPASATHERTDRARAGAGPIRH